MNLLASLDQEVNNLSLNGGMLAVLDVLGKYHECKLPLRWADLHDGVYDTLSELQTEDLGAHPREPDDESCTNGKNE